MGLAQQPPHTSERECRLTTLYSNMVCLTATNSGRMALLYQTLHWTQYNDVRWRMQLSNKVRLYMLAAARQLSNLRRSI